MLENVGFASFFVCYLIVLSLETIRVWKKRSQTFLIASYVTTFLGLILHSAFLYHNNLLQNERFFANANGWFYVLSFTLVVVSLYLTTVYPRIRFNLFFLPLALCLLCIGRLAGETTFTQDAACYWVRTIHGVSLLLATTLSMLGTVVGVMFFLQRNRLKRKVLPSLLNLPSLEWLCCAVNHSLRTAFLALGVGILSGFYLKAFVALNETKAREFDPVVVGTIVIFIVIMFFHIRSRFSSQVDANENAVLSFFCCASLFALLLFAVFSEKGHMKNLTVQSFEHAAIPVVQDVSIGSPPLCL